MNDCNATDFGACGCGFGKRVKLFVLMFLGMAFWHWYFVRRTLLHFMQNIYSVHTKSQQETFDYVVFMLMMCVGLHKFKHLVGLV